MTLINYEEYGEIAVQIFLMNILVPIVMGIGILMILVYGSSPHSDFLYDKFGCDLNDLSYCFKSLTIFGEGSQV